MQRPSRPGLLFAASLLIPTFAIAAGVRAPERTTVDPAAVPTSAGIVPPGAHVVTPLGEDLVSLSFTGRVERAALRDLQADLRSVHFLPGDGDSLYAVRVPRRNLETLLGLPGVERAQFSTRVVVGSRFSR
jgi:hypothetical protein